jgi:hypothetical protein
MQVIARDERDMEEAGAAPGVAPAATRLEGGAEASAEIPCPTIKSIQFCVGYAILQQSWLYVSTKLADF